jgi:glycosyltransferase involved in cell wall biosynthesis
MRIIYVCPRYPPEIGGVETHVSQLASHVQSLGVKVEVVTTTHEQESVDEVDGVVVRRFPGFPMARKYGIPLKLRNYILRWAGDRDLIHLHDYHALSALAAALSNVRPLVFTPHYQGAGHSRGSRFRHRLYEPLGSLVLRRATKVVCVSAAEAALLSDHFPAVTGRIAVIPNGVALDAVDAGSSVEAETGEPIVVSLGRLERYKRVDLTIRSTAHLPATWRLLVIGDGPARPMLTELANLREIRGRVDFLGSVEDDAVWRVLHQSCVLVTMSTREAFGLAPLEAIAAGTRVVASDIPAHRELRDRYAHGWMTLAPLDAGPASLAAVIQRIARQEPPPPAQLPTWEGVAKQTLQLYESILSASPTPAVLMPDYDVAERPR